MGKKRLNIVFFFIIMLIIYLLFEVVSSYIPGLLSSGIRNGKYGIYFIAELSWLLFVLFIIYMSGNAKALSNKREGFFKTLLAGFPILLMAVFYTFTNVKEIFSTSLVNLISLVLYCLAIGLTEELICRGWLLGEFLKRYSNKRKLVILSIVFSSLIFGGMHITNIWNAGQTVLETLIQILFATAAGYFFGCLYFRTRNLIAIAFLHGFYDFSIMAGDLNLLKDCIRLDNPRTTLYSFLFNIVLAIILIVAGNVIIRKSKTNELFDLEVSEEQKNKDATFKVLAVFGCIGAYMCSTFLLAIFLGASDSDTDKSQLCFKYPDIKLQYLETNYNNVDSYNIGNINIKLEDNNLNIYLDGKNYNIDKNIYDVKVIENVDNYIIIYYKGEDNSSDSIVYYLKINKDSVVESEEYVSNIKKNFIEFKLPIIVSIGSFKEVGTDYSYPFIKDYNNNSYMIDNNNVIRHIVVDPKGVSDLALERDKKENEELARKLIENIPFINFKNSEYVDAYNENGFNIDNVDNKVLFSSLYFNSNGNSLEIPVNLTICGDLNPCIGNLYVTKDDLKTAIKEVYNKEVEDIDSFLVTDGIVELTDDYYVYVKQEDAIKTEIISTITNYKKNKDTFEIEEVAGFIYGNTLSKFSEIDNSVVQVNDSRDELVNYFKNNKNSFVKFKHIFRLENDKYYYYETKVIK